MIPILPNFGREYKKPVLPKFSGIMASANSESRDTYAAAYASHPREFALLFSTTRILRELYTTKCAVNLIDEEPTDIHILGVSDGSVAFGYGIACHQLIGDDAKDDVRIIGVDRNAGLIALAKTGYLVCTKKERQEANEEPGHPLNGDGWNYYLKQTAAPTAFRPLTWAYPSLKQIERDLVQDYSVKNGSMDWYCVNQDDLPEIKFEPGDMRDYIAALKGKRQPQQIFVLANTWGYLHGMVNTRKQDKPRDFLKIIQDIRNANVGKKVYIVTGGLEKKVLNHIAVKQPYLIGALHQIGLHPLSEEELIYRGCDPAEAHVAEGNIWDLDTSSPCHYIA